VYHLAEDHHTHLVCEVCGAVVEASPELLATLERRARDDHGFELRTHHFALVGRCRACSGPD
jgi:Fe2+ or Zn2+ uptake regulation protein